MTIFDDAAAAANLGTASARKSGRNPAWSYVPIILNGDRQHQIRRFAYATRSEAVARAQASIDATRSLLAHHLADPRYRALREQYGLPRELTDIPTPERQP